MKVTTASNYFPQGVAYTTNQINLDAAYRSFTIKPILPSYYQYSGYFATTSVVTHQCDLRKKEPLTLDGTNDNNYWVTIYLEPTIRSTESIKPYSWHDT